MLRYNRRSTDPHLFAAVILSAYMPLAKKSKSIVAVMSRTVTLR